jgi:hypothetical protein
MKKIVFTILFSAFILSGCGTPAVEEDSSNDVVVDEKPSVVLDVETAKEALKVKHPDWDVSDMVATVDESDENFATGSVGDGPGGGMYFAANTDDGWVIAWDGNGLIGCADIEPYDFPTHMIPECYDYDTDTSIKR